MQILQSSLTTDVHLQAFAAQRANAPRRSSFNVSEVKDYKAHSDADLLSDGTQTDIESCVLRKEKQMIRCKGGNKFETLSICRDTSLTSCHSSIRCYGSKRCEEIKTIFPGCEGIHTTGCKCAKCN